MRNLFYVACSGAAGLMLASASPTFAQAVRRCGTISPPPATKQNALRWQQAFQRANLKLFRPDDGDRPENILSVPVHWHVIHKGAEGKVSKSDIDEQMKVMNEAFNAHRIRFSMASHKEHDKPEWFDVVMLSDAEWDMKKALHQGGVAELNIYCANAQGDLAWATFPWDAHFAPKYDGIVLRYTTLPNGSYPEINLGDTAVHEVGHWLGLFHVYELGCESPGDELDDTPFQAKELFGSCDENRKRDTCIAQPGDDPISNFMNTTNDSCLSEFSPMQEARMHDMAAIFRRGTLEREFSTRIMEFAPSR